MPVQPTQIDTANMTAPEEHKETPVTIGSDPEILFYSPFTNIHISANEYIHDGNCNLPFGCDGHSSTAELRPEPASDPIQHIKNIKNLFVSYAKKASYKSVFELSFYPSGLDDPIGGHIHVGHPLIAWKDSFATSADKFRFYSVMAKEILGMELTQEQYNSDYRSIGQRMQEKVEANRQRLSHTLDMLVSFPIMFTEVKEHAIQRKHSYGRLSDSRGKDYGIEYRTAPSWLGTERLAKSVMCLAYAVASDVLLKDYSPKKNFTTISGFNDLFKMHNTELLHPFLPEAEHEIKSLSLYPKYHSEINYLLYHAKKGTELFDHEIKLGWGIPFKALTQITLLTVKDLTEKVSQALSIPKGSDRVSLHTRYVTSNANDYMIPQIKDNINVCLNTIIPQSTQNKQAVCLFAKKREHGDIVTISNSYRSDMTYRRQRQLRMLIQSVAKSFNYPNPINVQIDNSYDEQQIDSNLKQTARIGLGRAIREQSNYLSEAIVFTILLFLNNNIYQEYTVDRKTGARVSKPILARSVISQFKKNLVNKEKELPNTSEDREEAQIEATHQSRYTGAYVPSF